MFAWATGIRETCCLRCIQRRALLAWWRPGWASWARSTRMGMGGPAQEIAMPRARITALPSVGPARAGPDDRPRMTSLVRERAG